jgi:cell division protein FtsW
MLRSSQIIMLCVVALLGLAVVMVHSAGMTVSTSHHGTLAILTSRNAVFAGIAVAAMLLASRINIREAYRSHGWFNPLAWALFLAVVLQFLTLVPHVGKEVNGARRWLAIGPVTFQPSELVKWVMVLAVAWWCARRGGIIHRFWHGLVPIGILISIGCGLIIKEDLGTAALIGMVRQDAWAWQHAWQHETWAWQQAWQHTWQHEAWAWQQAWQQAWAWQHAWQHSWQHTWQET